jgi:hypothetical protein
MCAPLLFSVRRFWDSLASSVTSCFPLRICRRQRTRRMGGRGDAEDSQPVAIPTTSWVLCPEHPKGCPPADQPVSARSVWEKYSPRQWGTGFGRFSPSPGLFGSPLDQPVSARSVWEQYSPRLWETRFSPSPGLSGSQASWQTYNPALWDTATPRFSVSLENPGNCSNAGFPRAGTSQDKALDCEREVLASHSVPHCVLHRDPHDPLEGTSTTYINLLDSEDHRTR